MKIPVCGRQRHRICIRLKDTGPTKTARKKNEKEIDTRKKILSNGIEKLKKENLHGQ